MRQRIGDLQQVGARHQILADALLQRDEEVAHAVELALQIGRFAAERTTGVHDGERQIVPDVGVDARRARTAAAVRRDGAGTGTAAASRPAGGVRPPPRPRPRDSAAAKRTSSVTAARRVGEVAAVDAPVDLLRHRQIDPVEDRDPVRRRPVRRATCACVPPRNRPGPGGGRPGSRSVPSAPFRQRPSRRPDGTVTGRGFPERGTYGWVSYVDMPESSRGSCRYRRARSRKSLSRRRTS